MHTCKTRTICRTKKSPSFAVFLTCLSCPCVFSCGMQCGLFQRGCRGGGWGVRHAGCVDEAALDVGRGTRLDAAAPGEGTGLWQDGLAQTFLHSHEYLWAPEKAQSSSAALIPWLKSFFLSCRGFFLRGEDGVGVLVSGFFSRMRRFQYTAAVVKTIHVHHSALLEEYSALRTNIWEQSDRNNISGSLCNFPPLSNSGGVTRQDGDLRPREQQKLFSWWIVATETVWRSPFWVWHRRQPSAASQAALWSGPSCSVFLCP